MGMMLVEEPLKTEDEQTNVIENSKFKSREDQPHQLNLKDIITPEESENKTIDPNDVNEPTLAIAPPTWASIAEKPKPIEAAEHVPKEASDVIALPPHKVSTIVVAVEEEDRGEVTKEIDEEGFKVVKSKRESKVYLETETNQQDEKEQLENDNTVEQIDNSRFTNDV